MSRLTKRRRCRLARVGDSDQVLGWCTGYRVAPPGLLSGGLVVVKMRDHCKEGGQWRCMKLEEQQPFKRVANVSMM